MGKQLSWSTKVLYGVGEVAVSAKNAALSQFLLFFYVDVVHLSPYLVGTALFLGRFWDAITDPIVGYLSDTTRSRWGRRRPFVVAASIPMGFGFYLLFAPPGWSETGLFIYLLAAYVGLMTVFTLYATPYLAWSAELTDDYHERTSVVQTRALFGVVGSLAGSAAPVAIAGHFDNERTGFALAAAALGALMAAAGLATGCGVPELRRSVPPAPSWGHFWSGLRRTMQAVEFLRIFAVFCAMTLAGSLGNAVQLFVIKYWLGLYDFFPAIALTFGLAFVGSFPIWRALSRAVGKHNALLYGLGLGCVVPWGWFLVPPGHHGAMLVFAAAGGMSMGSVTLALSSAIDIIDIDEWHTGERREGAYFGIWTLGLKTMGAVGALLGGVLVSWAGAGATPQAFTADQAWRLLWVVGPLQVASNAFGFAMLRRIRWGPEDASNLQEALAARRRQNV